MLKVPFHKESIINIMRSSYQMYQKASDDESFKEVAAERGLDAGKAEQQGVENRILVDNLLSTSFFSIRKNLLTDYDDQEMLSQCLELYRNMPKDRLESIIYQAAAEIFSGQIFRNLNAYEHWDLSFFIDQLSGFALDHNIFPASIFKYAVTISTGFAGVSMSAPDQDKEIKDILECAECRLELIKSTDDTPCEMVEKLQPGDFRDFRNSRLISRTEYRQTLEIKEKLSKKV